MNYSTWLAATVALGVGSLAIPAYANSPQPTPEKLPSMEEVLGEEVLVTEPQRTVVLNRLAEEMDRRMGHSDESDSTTTIDDVIQSPLLDGLLDDNGELNLPLGLTVYDAMGATSIGFGSKF